MSPRFLTELDRVGRLLRSTAQGVALRWWLAIVLGGTLAIVLIDAVGRFTDPGLRWVFSAMWLALAGWAAWCARRIAAPTATDTLSVARRVEGQNPRLGSKLSSAVAFALGDEGDPYAGSAELRRRVVLDADSGTSGIDFAGVVDRGPLRRTGRGLAAVAGVAALLALVSPTLVLTGLARLAAPWSAIEWPRRNHLELVERVTTAPLGSTLEVAAIDRNGAVPDDVRFEVRSGSEARVESQPMSIVGREAVARRDDLREGFEYRVVGGDDLTMEWVALQVVTPPQVTGFEVRAIPPAYTGLAPVTLEGAIRVVEGTRLALRAEVNEPLAAAALELPNDQKIAAVTTAAPSGGGVTVTTVDDAWIATPPPTADAKASDPPATATSASPEYRLAMTSAGGIEASTPPRPYEVLRDAPPSPVWRSPSADTFLTARGLVPLAVAATDDLGVRGVAVRWSLGDSTEQADKNNGPAPAPRAGSVVLADYGATPPQRDALGDAPAVVAELEWDVAPLGLKPGDRLELAAVAADYKPQEGRAPLVRRLTVVTDEEFESLLGEKQSRLLAEVQRAVDRQREARDRGADLLADIEAGKPIDRSTVDRLASLEFEQRAAEGVVADPARGAAKQARDLLDELRRSRLERPQLAEQLDRARGALAELAEGLMADTRREIGAARRAAQRAEPSRDEVRPSLGEVAADQSEAVDRLEQIAQGLTGWSDFQRFADELAALAKRQQELAGATAGEAARAAGGERGPLDAVESKAQRDKLLGAQAEVGRRFGKLAAAMQELLDKSAGPNRQDGAADAVEDSLEEGRERDVAGSLRDASRDLAMGRLGRATSGQAKAAEDLKSMLETLRQRAPATSEALVAALREASERLSRVEQQAGAMSGAERPDQRSGEDAAKEAERIARRLKRLTAPEAGQSAQRGAQSLAGSPPEGGEQGGSGEQGQQGQQGGAPKPEQAKKDFEQAQKQIAERVRQLENQIAQRLLDKLREQIDGMLTAQREVLQGTLAAEADAGGATPEGDLARRVATLAASEEDLRDRVTSAAEALAGRAVFSVALRGAAGELASAAALLDRRDVGRDTQRHEADALGRLKHVADVLRENQRQQEEQKKQGGEGGGGGQQQKPSLVDVAELKMLRLMQLELITRTDVLEADAAGLIRQGRALSPAWLERAERLEAEQRSLAELALEMTERNNDPDAPGASPSDPAPTP